MQREQREMFHKTRNTRPEEIPTHSPIIPKSGLVVVLFSPVIYQRDVEFSG